MNLALTFSGNVETAKGFSCKIGEVSLHVLECGQFKRIMMSFRQISWPKHFPGTPHSATGWSGKAVPYWVPHSGYFGGLSSPIGPISLMVKTRWKTSTGNPTFFKKLAAWRWCFPGTPTESYRIRSWIEYLFFFPEWQGGIVVDLFLPAIMLEHFSFSAALDKFPCGVSNMDRAHIEYLRGPKKMDLWKTCYELLTFTYIIRTDLLLFGTSPNFELWCWRSKLKKCNCSLYSCTSWALIAPNKCFWEIVCTTFMAADLRKLLVCWLRIAMAWWHLELTGPRALARAQRVVLALAFGCFDEGVPWWPRWPPGLLQVRFNLHLPLLLGAQPNLI